MEPQKNIARLLKQLTFVPSAIYKTSNITDAVMINANYNISNMFPHLAIACALINNKAKITFTKHPVVKMILTENTASSNIRGCADNHPHPQMKKMFWELGYLNSIKMIKDKKLRSAIMDDMQPQNGTFAQVVKRVVKEGLKDKQLFFDYLMGLDTKHFLKFILFLFIVFDKRKSGYYILLLGRISVKVWPAKK